MPQGRTFEEVFTEARYIPEWIESGRSYGIEEEWKQILRLIEQGYTTEQLKAKMRKKLHPEPFFLTPHVRAVPVENYFHVLIQANPEACLAATQERPEELFNILAEAGFIPNWMERGRVLGMNEYRKRALEYIDQGYTLEQITAALTEDARRDKANGKCIIAKNLKKLDVPFEKIAQATGLSPDEIAKL
jgi:hypothetical protein